MSRNRVISQDVVIWCNLGFTEIEEKQNWEKMLLPNESPLKPRARIPLLKLKAVKQLETGG